MGQRNVATGEMTTAEGARIATRGVVCKWKREVAIGTHEKRIDVDVFALYGVDGLPGDDA